MSNGSINDVVDMCSLSKACENEIIIMEKFYSSWSVGLSRVLL